MNLKKYIGLAALALATTASAQTSISFENETDFSSLGVYDSWADSPFMTNEMEGNYGITDNPYLDTDDGNSTSKVLAFQRSRYGGNQYGVRINLNTPIELSETDQYVHVLIHKPKSGRVMLTGLGTNVNNTGQVETEQFNELSTATIGTDAWVDAVFAIAGAPGAQVTALVVVPDCESTHDLEESFTVYIDEIAVSSSATPRAGAGNYPVNVETTDTLQRTDRYTNTVGLTSPTAGAQTLTVNQQSTKLVYNEFMDSTFVAQVGETLTPAIGYSAWAMHGYVYIDFGLDGKFSYGVTDNVPTSGSDLMSFSYYNGYNSAGTTGFSTAGSAGHTPPTFTIPEDATPGFYRMRYKVDWNNIDPAGSTATNNTITGNGGVIVDTRINVHAANVTITRAAGDDGVGGLNGDILKADGSEFTTESIPFGSTYTIKHKPAPGFRLSHVMLRHGYNFDGAESRYGTKQYEDVRIPAAAFSRTDSTYTIPAEYVDGDVRLIPYFSAVGSDNYPVSVSETTTLSRSDRYTNTVGLTSTADGTQSITVGQQTSKLVYNDLTAQSFKAKAGETVTPAIGYTGNAMHGYVYVDFGVDGDFSYDLDSDGRPYDGTDLMTFSYYSGKNSEGTTTASSVGVTPPTFTIPTYVTPGFYRMRYKVDWDNVSPAGNTSSTNTITANGGVIVDTRLNVHTDNVTVKAADGITGGSVLTSDGDAIGADGVSTTFGSAYTFKLEAEADYELKSVVIRHGYNLTGEQYVYDTKQYDEITLTADELADVMTSTGYTIAAASVDGDILIIPVFSGFELSADKTWFTTDDAVAGFAFPVTCTKDVTGTTATGVTLKKTTYNTTYNGATPTTEEVENTIGLEYEGAKINVTFAKALAEGTYKLTLPAGAVTADGDSNYDAYEFEFTVANFVPTTIVDDAFAAGTKWYVFKFAKINETTQYTVSGSASSVTIGNSTDFTNDAQLWCFVGDQATGYTIYNKALGTGYVLASSTTMSGTNGGSTVVTMMTPSAVTSGYTSTWGIISTTHSSVPATHGDGQHYFSGRGGYYIYQFDTPANAINNRATNLSFWTTGLDDGSTFNFEECVLLDATTTVTASPEVSKHYRYSRTFGEGWNTLYLPFATTKTDLGAADVQVYNEDHTTTSSTLSFVQYTDEAITAFTPLLVNFEASTEKVLTYTGTVEAFDATTGANKQGDWTFKGNLVSGFSMSGLYGVVRNAEGEQVIKRGSSIATLGSMLCYFEGPSNLSAPGISISFGSGGITNIDGVEIHSATDAPVYNLQGVCVGNSVENLPAGLYIVGGKKVLVK